MLPVCLAMSLAAAQAPAVVTPAASGPRVVAVDYTGDVADRGQLRRLSTIKLGQPLDPASVRETLALYYETGRFEGITVTSSPAPGGIKLAFDFRRQAIITAWRFAGNRHLGADVLARALDLQWGQALNTEKFTGFTETIRERYGREGYPRASARFSVERPHPGEATLLVTIDEGMPTRVAKVEVLRTGERSAPNVAPALGVKAGDVLKREDLLAGLDRVEGLLSENGFLNSHVGYSFLLPDGTRTTSFDDMLAKAPDHVTVQVALEAGQKALVSVEGEPLLPATDMAKAITVYKNRSYSPFELDASAEHLRQLYVSNAYPNAKVTHDVARQPDGSYLITFHVDPGAKVVIRRIRFEGNQAFDDKTLSAQLITRPAGLMETGAFDPDIWADDVADLQAFYASRGYLTAKITGVDRTLEPDGGHVELTVHVEEGPRTLVSRLLVTGATRAQEGGILQALPIDPGDPYNPRKLPELISSIQAYYARTGYPLAHVTATYEGAPPQNGRIAGALRFTVEPGPLKRIGHVVLRGNVKTRDSVVRRQLTVKTGQIYNAEDLFKSQQQIYQLGFFDRVEVDPLRPPSARSDEPVDLVVTMHERESGWISVGGGYDGIGNNGTGSSSATQPLTGFDLSAEYVQNNLLGRGWPLRLEGEYGPARKVGTFTLRDPYLWNSGYIGESGFSFQRIYQTPTFEVQSWGPSVGLSRQITKTLLGSLRYSWSRVNYLQFSDLDLWSAGGAPDRIDSIVTAGVTYDTRPDLLNPRWGTKAEFNVDFATPVLGGTLVYTRPRVDLAHYFPLPHKIVFALGGDAAYIQTLASNSLLPNDVRFLAGGAQSLRGYDYNMVGVPAPFAPGCTPHSDPSLCVTGGTVLVVGHAELRFPIFGDFGGAVFTDVGNVWATPTDMGLADLKVTAGVGARYETPLGPVRVDYGFRVRPALEFGRNFYFGLGQAF